MPQEALCGTIETIRIGKLGIRFVMSHPIALFWAYVPGSGRSTPNRKKKSLVLINVYSLDRALEILKSVPLTNPDKYMFDFDLADTGISLSVQFKVHGWWPCKKHLPRKVGKTKTDAGYVTTVDVTELFNRSRKLVS